MHRPIPNRANVTKDDAIKAKMKASPLDTRRLRLQNRCFGAARTNKGIVGGVIQLHS